MYGRSWRVRDHLSLGGMASSIFGYISKDTPFIFYDGMMEIDVCLAGIDS